MANIDSSKKPLTNPEDNDDLPQDEPLELDQIQIRTKLNEGIIRQHRSSLKKTTLELSIISDATKKLSTSMRMRF